MGIFMVLSFLLVVGVVWHYAYSKSRAVNIDSTEGYFMGGRSLSALAVAGTVIMTNLSTEQIVGQNGQSYVGGMEVMAWEVTAAIAITAFATIFLPKYFRLGINTISDFLEIRYDVFTKRVVSVLFIVTYIVSFLPVVLYSGALVFNQLFKVDQIFNVSPMTGIVIVVAAMGLVGLSYLLLGGLSLSATSDTIYGFGLIVLGLSIPVLGLIKLGDGSFVQGLDHVVMNTPWLLNSVGAVDSKFVPWPALFTGMLFNNLYFWCTNQMIVQKSLAAKNLVEAQKAQFIIGFFKVFGALFLVFPGILGRNIFGDAFLSNPDSVYPALVTEVLPNYLQGLFAAVIFGAVLSSFVGALNSTATLLSLDFYKAYRPEADDEQVVRVAKRLTIAVGVAAMIVAPFIAFAPSGLYALVQEINGLYSISLLTIILFAFYSKTATAKAAKFTLIGHVLFYGLFKLILPNIHYLYIFAIMFVVDCLIMVVVPKMQTQEEQYELDVFESYEEVEEWKYTKVASIILIATVLLTYLAFSPIGLASL